VVECGRGTVLEHGTVRVTAAPTDHAPVRPTVGFRVEEEGRSVVIAGDTVPCEGLDELCAGADMLVHTVARPDLIRAIGLPRFVDVLDYHSSVEDAAKTAARNGVGTLVLTHLIPAPEPGTEDEWIAMAAAQFDGTVVVAHDLLSLDVGPPA
jgi:ribonuclease Z